LSFSWQRYGTDADGCIIHVSSLGYPARTPFAAHGSGEPVEASNPAEERRKTAKRLPGVQSVLEPEAAQEPDSGAMEAPGAVRSRVAELEAELEKAKQEVAAKSDRRSGHRQERRGCALGG